MASLAVRIGCRSDQGHRPNNEDRYLADPAVGVFMVADGMGGQDRGEVASALAVEIVPQAIKDRLAAEDEPAQAVQQALASANSAIIAAGDEMPKGRRMGTTAVLALQQDGHVYVASIGDSRAYLIRQDLVDLMTVDHSVAQAMVSTGALTPEEARTSPWQHVLHKFLGCVTMTDSAEVHPFDPEPGDRLLLASDGLTNHVEDEDLRVGARQFPDPQEWADYLVETALKRGSRDNITCVVVAFEKE